jgi:hypothetical protein
MIAGRRTLITAAGLLALVAGLSACQNTGSGPGRAATFEASVAEVNDGAYYRALLADLPLRTGDPQWEINLRPGHQGTMPAVREVHLLRDQRNPTLDLLIVVWEDRWVQAVSARDFTVRWASSLSKRTPFAPIMTSRSIYFVDTNGSYQKLDRRSGAVVGTGDFGLASPAGQLSSNDSHVLIPTTTLSAVAGVADDDGSAGIGAPQDWRFPSRFDRLDHQHGMVTFQPVADLESIYFVCSNNYLYGIDAQNGGRRFVKDLGRVGTIRNAPLLHRDVVYVGTDTQLHAFSRSGDELWSFTPDGPIQGGIYAMDDMVFFRTVELSSSADDSGRFGGLTSGRTTQPGGDVRLVISPKSFSAVSVTRSQPPVLDQNEPLVPGEPDPVRRDDRGELITDVPVIRGPRQVDWSLPNLGQEVLVKSNSMLFVKMEEWDMPFDPETRRHLRRSGRVIKDSELRRVTNRLIQVLDPKTGALLSHGNEPASYRAMDFQFVLGSQDSTDRAIYFVTKDGWLFKGFATR